MDHEQGKDGDIEEVKGGFGGVAGGEVVSEVYLHCEKNFEFFSP